jgi:hypothetical protein
MRSIVRSSLLGLAIALLATPVFAQSNRLVGSWRLIAADKILPDGRQVADFGATPSGIAIFTREGQYVVEIFQADRKKFASGDRTKGTPEEYRDAVLSTSCHFGTYSVDAGEGTIIFNIAHASYPNWDQTSRTSPFTLRGDTLAWRVPARPDGAIPVSVFTRVQ